MIRCRNSSAWLILIALAVAAAGTGCRQESSEGQANARRPTPDESFEQIAQLMKEGIEVRSDTVSGFHVSNTVTSRILPPSSPADPYRGTITVTSRSIYSLHHSGDDEKKSAEDERPVEDYSYLDETDESDSGFESLDESLISQSSDPRGLPTATEIIERRDEQNVRTYDLTYENGRWVLTTVLDPKTEQSIQNAFNRALSRQP